MRRFRRHTPIETYLLFDRAEPPPEKRVKEKDGVVANILIIEQQRRRRRRLNVLQHTRGGGGFGSQRCDAKLFRFCDELRPHDVIQKQDKHL